MIFALTPCAISLRLQLTSVVAEASALGEWSLCDFGVPARNPYGEDSPASSCL